MTPLAEKLHTRFRGASEFVKVTRGITLLVDAGAATLAGLGIFSVYKSPWVPLVLLFAAVASVAGKSWHRRFAGTRSDAGDCHCGRFAWTKIWIR